MQLRDDETFETLDSTSFQSPRVAPWPSAAEGRVAIPSPRCAKALSVIATSEHKRRGQMEAEEKLDTGNVLRHALRAHASNMASHVDMIAGKGPTQRQLPRTSSARVQYEDIAVAAALDEYELDEGEEEGEQEGAATGIFITASRVPAHQLPGATAAPAVATATYDDYDEDDEGVPQQPQQQQHASSAWASARREPVGPPHNSRTTAMAAAPARTGPPAWDGPAAAASSAVPASSGDSDAGSSASGRVGFKLHLPRTDQLLRKLKIFNAHRGGHGGANSSRASNSAIGAITTADGVGSEGQPSPPRRLATTGSIDSSSNENSSSSNVQADGFGRTVSPPKGSQYGTATPPPSGYLSMPPSASPTSRLSWMASTAANAAAPSPPPSRHLQQQELAALARARGSGGAADADAAAVSPTRSAGSFTADMGGCRRPSLTQLFPESDTAGGGGALSGLMGDLGRGLSRELLYATGEDGTAAGGVAAMQCSARHSFSNQALVRQPGQRRGSMVVLPSSGMCGGAGGINPASQGLRPTMARANMARLARRSVTCLEDYPYAAVPMDAPAAGADAGAGFAVGASVPVSPVSPAVKSPGAGDSGSGRAHLGFRAAAEALFNKVTRSPARGAAAAGQEWYPGADVSPGQPPLSPSTLRFASATVGSAGGAGAASPFATAAAGASVYRRAGSSGLASPIASPGTSSATNLFAGMITAAGGANGAPSSGGGGSAGGSATTSARARVAPPNPLQVAATQSGEAWFVGRTASAMQQASASASSSSRRLLPTPSSQAAAPISGGSSFISSVAANPNTGGSAVPRLTPAVLQPRAASTNTSPLPVLPPGSSVPLGVGQGRAAGNGGPGFGERMHALSP